MTTPQQDALAEACAHFQRGIELSTKIRKLVERNRRWYLGESPKLPRRMMSSVINPETGPIAPYFSATLQLLHKLPRTQFAECVQILSAFETASADTLESLRRFTIDLTPFLNPATAISCKNALLAFRVASSHFFRAMRTGQSVLPACFDSDLDAGLGLLAANNFLRDITQALGSRERQLNESAGLAMDSHTPFAALMSAIIREGGKIRKTVKSSAQRTIREITAKRRSDYERRGPSTSAREAQVHAVVQRIREFEKCRQLLPEPLREKSPDKWIHQACVDAWSDLAGGYPTPDALYVFCHRNEESLLSLSGL